MSGRFSRGAGFFRKISAPHYLESFLGLYIPLHNEETRIDDSLNFPIFLTQKTDKFSIIRSGMFIPDPGFGFVFASRIRILYLKVKKHRIRIRNISGLDPDLDSPKSRFRIHQIAIRNQDPYFKEPKNRFRGIYPPGWESILGLLTRFTSTGSCFIM